MNRRLIIVFGIIFLAIISIPFVLSKTKDTIKEVGKAICLTPKYFSLRVFFIYFLCICLIIFILLGFQDSISNYVMAICSVMGFYLANKLAFNMHYIGVFEKGIVTPVGIGFKFSDIESFEDVPESDELTDKEREQMILMNTKKLGPLKVKWTSKKDCEKIKKALKEMNYYKN